MRIRDISLEERHEIGRRLYEARKSPMTWAEAVEVALSDGPDIDASNAALSMLARDYALRSGKSWPAVRGHWMTYPGAMEREAARRASLPIKRGAEFKRRREALGMTTAEVAALFPGCPVSEIEKIEAEGPEDARDNHILSRAFDRLEYEASLPPSRDWLILTDQAA